MTRWLLTGVAIVALNHSVALPAQSRGVETARIIDEGMNRSQVMLTASELMDGIGPRLTNSRNARRAQAWAIDKMQKSGLTNVHREGFDFGRGWDLIDASATMITPRRLKMTTIPVAWTPGTNGPVRAAIVVAPMNKVEHFAAWRGKLAGKIVLVSLPGKSEEPKEAPFQRLSDAEIAKYDRFDLPDYDPETIAMQRKRMSFSRELDTFLKSEGALAWVRKSYRDNGLVTGEGSGFGVGITPTLPGFELAAEDYRRLTRLAKTGPAPEIELVSDVRFDDSDTQAQNLFGDIAGSDPKAGFVMAGAHFDSWIAGDGASDNGAGSVVVLEAARILKSLGVRPRRTIRFVLWDGEEQGLFGSRAWLDRHMVHRPVPAGLGVREAGLAWSIAYPITPRPGYGSLKAYFNMDNGSGKLRGLYAEQNSGAEPLLKEWLAPFGSLDADKVVASKTDGTDHVYLQEVGLPGYQFIQDPLDYDSRVHHSNLDTLDHMRADDLRQASVVLAGVLLAAANSDKELPRAPLPTQPRVTDPFAYPDPDKR